MESWRRESQSSAFENKFFGNGFGGELRIILKYFESPYSGVRRSIK
jgi:hypothetical protein